MQRIAVLLVGLATIPRSGAAQQAAGTALWRLAATTLPLPPALASDVALTIHPHPTLSETVMESAEVFFGTSAHIYRPKRG